MPRAGPDPTETVSTRRLQVAFHPELDAVMSNRGPHLMNNIHKNVEVGKYLVSPLSKLADNGQYLASVSIRSGRGSATHDRVLRFAQPFTCPDAAAAYATSQGLAWVDERRRALLN